MKATSQQLLLTGTGSLGDNLSAVLIYLTKTCLSSYIWS
jgi:hypothetical protein